MPVSVPTARRVGCGTGTDVVVVVARATDTVGDGVATAATVVVVVVTAAATAVGSASSTRLSRIDGASTKADTATMGTTRTAFPSPAVGGSALGGHAARQPPTAAIAADFGHRGAVVEERVDVAFPGEDCREPAVDDDLLNA